GYSRTAPVSRHRMARALPASYGSRPASSRSPSRTRGSASPRRTSASARRPVRRFGSNGRRPTTPRPRSGASASSMQPASKRTWPPIRRTSSRSRSSDVARRRRLAPNPVSGGELARLIKVSELIDRTLQVVDRQNTLVLPRVEVMNYLSTELGHFYEVLVDSGEIYCEKTAPPVTTTGGALYPLPGDFFKELRFDYLLNGWLRPLVKVSIQM